MMCDGCKLLFMANFVDSGMVVSIKRLLVSMYELEPEFGECWCNKFSIEETLKT